MPQAQGTRRTGGAARLQPLYDVRGAAAAQRQRGKRRRGISTLFDNELVSSQQHGRCLAKHTHHQQRSGEQGDSRRGEYHQREHAPEGREPPQSVSTA